MIKLDNPEQPVSWGFHAYRYFHPSQKVAFDLEQKWREIKGWNPDFQNMNKEEMVTFLEVIVNSGNSLLKQAKELSDDGKKPSDFPPIEDSTSELLTEIAEKKHLKLT